MKLQKLRYIKNKTYFSIYKLNNECIINLINEISSHEIKLDERILFMNLREDVRTLKILFAIFFIVALAVIMIKSIISVFISPIQFFSFILGIILVYGS